MRYEDNIKTNLQEVGFVVKVGGGKGVNCMHLSRDRKSVCLL
jgi:hypothetical protein